MTTNRWKNTERVGFLENETTQIYRLTISLKCLVLLVLKSRTAGASSCFFSTAALWMPLCFWGLNVLKADSEVKQICSEWAALFVCTHGWGHCWGSSCAVFWLSVFSRITLLTRDAMLRIVLVAIGENTRMNEIMTNSFTWAWERAEEE